MQKCLGRTFLKESQEKHLGARLLLWKHANNCIVFPFTTAKYAEMPCLLSFFSVKSFLESDYKFEYFNPEDY